MPKARLSNQTTLTDADIAQIDKPLSDAEVTMFDAGQDAGRAAPPKLPDPPQLAIQQQFQAKRQQLDRMYAGMAKANKIASYGVPAGVLTDQQQARYQQDVAKLGQQEQAALAAVPGQPPMGPPPIPAADGVAVGGQDDSDDSDELMPPTISGVLQKAFSPPPDAQDLPQLPGPDLSWTEKAGIVGQAFMGPFAIPAAIDTLGTSANETNPQFQADRQQYGQPLEGMIPTPENIDKFNAIKSGIAKQLADSGHPDAAVDALSYMGARYPRRMQMPSSIQPTKHLDRGVGGMYVPPLTNKTGGSIWYPEQTPGGESLISTLGHETQHAVDTKRKGVDFLGEGIPNYTIMGMKTSIKQDRNTLPFDVYKNLPSEARAYRAGDTAKRGYGNYLKISPYAVPQFAGGGSVGLPKPYARHGKSLAGPRTVLAGEAGNELLIHNDGSQELLDHPQLRQLGTQGTDQVLPLLRPSGPKEVLRGSSNIPLDEQGQQEAQINGQRYAGQFDSIDAGPLLRTQQTAGVLKQTNPQAQFQLNPDFKDMGLGQLEGQQVTIPAIEQINHMVLQEPDMPFQGQGPLSTAPGDSFNGFKGRVIGGLTRLMAKHAANPGLRSAVVTHNRVLRVIKGWEQKGFNPSGAIDPDPLIHYHKGASPPGSVEHLSQNTATGRWQLNQVAGEPHRGPDGKIDPGIYLFRHGRTQWNAPGNKG